MFSRTLHTIASNINRYMVVNRHGCPTAHRFSFNMGPEGGKRELGLLRYTITILVDDGLGVTWAKRDQASCACEHADHHACEPCYGSAIMLLYDRSLCVRGLVCVRWRRVCVGLVVCIVWVVWSVLLKLLSGLNFIALTQWRHAQGRAQSRRCPCLK